MKRKIIYRLTGLFLAGLLAFESMDLAVFAMETEAISESASNEQEQSEVNGTESIEAEESQYEEDTTAEEASSEETESVESETTISSQTESEDQSTSQEHNTETVEESEVLENTTLDETVITEEDTNTMLSDENETEEVEITEEIINNSSVEVVQGDFTYTITGTEATITKYTGDAINLVIPNTLDGYTVTGLKEYAFRGTVIKIVTIPNTITRCGYSFSNGPFSGAMDLEEVIFEDGMTEIPAYMLSNRDNISYVKTVTIPNTITEIGDHAFQDCGNITEISLPKSVKKIGGGAFADCTGLETFTMGDNTEEFEISIGSGAFAGDTNLTNIRFAENVTSIDTGAFSGCSKLEKVTLPSQLRSLGYMVFKGTDIKTITIPKTVTFCDSQVGCDGPFAEATKLEEVIFEEGMTLIPKYALQKSYVKTVTIPNTITEIGDHAFQGCGNITEISLPKSVKKIGGGAFADCTGLETFIMGDNTEEFEISIESATFAGDTNLTNIRFAENVTTIGDYTFSGCSKLETITLPSQLKSLGYCAFKGTGIKSITIPKTVTSCSAQLTGSGYDGPFAGAAKLETVIFENGMTSIPWYILSSQSYTSYIKKAYIPSTVKSIGYEAFYKCENLTIYGIANSYAQTYANDNNIPFVEWDGTITTTTYFVGELKAIDTENKTITIDKTKYDVSNNFPFDKAQNILTRKTGKNVICTLYYDEITDIDALEDILELTAMILDDSEKMIYYNGHFAPESVDMSVRVMCEVRYPYAAASLQGVDGIELSLKKIKVTLAGDGINLGKTLFNNKVTEKEEKVNTTVKVNELRDFQFTVYADENYIPSVVNPEFSVNVSLDGNADIPCTLYCMSNLDYQKQLAEKKKQENASQSAYSNAKKELEKLCNNHMLLLAADLQYYLDAEQIRQVEEYLYVWLAEVNNANTYTDDKKVNKKIMSKLGINPNLGFIWNTTKATTQVKIKTVYGQKTFEFTLSLGSLQSNGTTYGSFGDIHYEVLEKKGIPSNVKTEGVLGVTTYTSMKDFANCMQDVAEDSVKKAYDSVWGKDANTVAAMLVDDVILKIIDARYGSFSNAVYTIGTEPVKQYVKKMKVHCPVDVYIYDMQENLCGAIVNDEVDKRFTNIAIYMEDGAKVFYLTGDDYKIKLVGNGEGTMSYAIEELDEDMVPLRTVQFDNIPLENEKMYAGFVYEPFYIDNELYELYDVNSEIVVQPDTDTYQDGLEERVYVSGIELDHQVYELKVGESIQLNAKIIPENATNTKVRWRSEKNDIATVNENGIVIALNTGKADIIAASDDGAFEAVCEIRVPKGESETKPDTNYEGVLPEDIPEAGIPNGLWIAGVTDQIYTGVSLKPEIRVYDGNKRLKSGIDYTANYKNNKKANDASNTKTAPTIVVKGKGNYAGTETASFKIFPVDLTDQSISTDTITQAYNEKIQKPIPVICFNGKKLKNKTDFTLTYPDVGIDAYKAIGTYHIKVVGRGNFTGEIDIPFTVTDSVLITKAKVNSVPVHTYNDGRSIEPIPIVRMGKEDLIEGTDYNVSYQNNTKIGTAYIILTGIGKYAGIKKVSFKIIGTSIKNASIEGITNYKYTGNTYVPDIKVTLNGVELVKNTDYKMTCTKNINAGTAVIKLEGINSYSGTIQRKFKILPYDIGENMQKLLQDNTGSIVTKYTKGGVTPEPKLYFGANTKRLVKGKDYTITYKDNKSVSSSEKSSTMTIKGKGNFKGTIIKTFTIESKSLTDAESPITLSIPDKAYSDKVGKYKSVPILTDVNGNNLKIGMDYEKTIEYTLIDGTELTDQSNPEVGTVINVKIIGKGAYTGITEGSYQITAADFSKAKITIEPQAYTGKAIIPDVSAITVKVNGKSDSLVYGIDYEIVVGSCKNNINKGTASISIKGKGNYGGTKIVKFKITAKSMTWFWRLFG